VGRAHPPYRTASVLVGVFFFVELVRIVKFGLVAESVVILVLVFFEFFFSDL
jgi:hypothetical protein